MPPMARKSWILALLGTAALAGAAFYRLRFGIDFTDEAYYATMAVRFLRGDVPFRDELFINQTAVLETLPLVRGYYARHGTEGIVYFLRLLYFAFALVLGICAFVSLGKRRAALGAALLAVVFVPLNISAPSYNTIGGGAFALAIFFGINGGRTRWALASLCLALSVFAYPPLAGAALVFGYLNLKDRKDPKLLGSACLGIAIVALTYLPFFQRVGADLSYSLVYSWSAHHHGGGLSKLVYVFQFQAMTLFSLGGFLSLVCLALAYRLKSASFLVVYPALLFLTFRNWIYPSEWVFGYFALAAPVFFLLGPRTKTARQLFRQGWLPSALAGLTTAWVSSGSPVNLIIGLWGGGILSAYFFFEAISHTSRPKERSALTVLAPSILLGGFTLFLFVGQVFYCDGVLPRLTQKIEAGPFKGLYTTAEKYEYLTEITSDIRKLENLKGKIVFYEFPAGYLLTEMRAGVNSAWLRTESTGKRFYVKYFREHASPEDLIFAIRLIDHGYLSPIEYSPDDPFLNEVKKSRRLVLSKPRYDVFTN